jgi:hypothetical protein
MLEEIIEKLNELLEGEIPERIDTDTLSDEEEGRLSEALNRLFAFMAEMRDFIIPLSEGKLDNVKPPSRKNFLGSPFKALHANLLHLTWQAKQVAAGDYRQRVDFMGDFSEAFNTMIISLAHNEKMLKNKIEELQEALCHISKLEGILPICASCKKVRIEGADPKCKDSWFQLESYISGKTHTQFSHTLCPECMKRMYPDFMD